MKVLGLQCLTDNRKSFPKYNIKILFDNLPKLKEIKFKWILDKNETNPTDNPIFVKSELEEIVGECENEFNVETNEDDTLIKVTK